MKGFMLSTDAFLAVGFALILAGAVIDLSQNAPSDVYWGTQALARDYLVLKYQYGLGITNASAPVPAQVTVYASRPAVTGYSPYWHAEIYYWPPGFFNCSTSVCQINAGTSNESMFYSQDEFNGSTYHYDSWATG